MNNIEQSFEDFWIHYPRKIAKHYARQIFARLTPEHMFAAVQSIPIHAKYWKLAERDLEKIPHASTWLNQRRWEDELEMPTHKADAEWMRSQSGIEAKARELDMWPPKKGEDWHSLKARILARVA